MISTYYTYSVLEVRLVLGTENAVSKVHFHSQYKVPIG